MAFGSSSPRTTATKNSDRHARLPEPKTARGSGRREAMVEAGEADGAQGTMDPELCTPHRHAIWLREKAGRGSAHPFPCAEGRAARNAAPPTGFGVIKR